MVVFTPKQWAEAGQAAYNRGEYLAAAQAFQSSEDGYLLAGDKLMAAEMANNRSVSLLKEKQTQAALLALDNTIAIFSEAGDVRRQAMALGNLGSVLEALNKLEEASEAFQKSAELLQSQGEEEMYTSVMQSLSAVQLRLGQQMEALVSMQAGLNKGKKLSPTKFLVKKLLRMPFKLLNR